MGTVMAGLCFAQEDANELVLEVSQMKTIPVFIPNRVAISNPQAADVTKVSEKEVVITAKAAGRTTLVIWDKSGQRAYSIRVVSDGLSDIKLRIDKLVAELGYPDVYSKLSNEEDKVMLLGTVDTEDEKKKLDSILEVFKEKTIDMVALKPYSELVQIDVEIMEISKNALEDLGFDWTTSLGDKAAAGLKWTENNVEKDNQIFEVFQLSRTWERSAISYQLNLIMTQGKGRILSRPKLVCLSGKEATFLVGGEVPVLTATVASGGTTLNVTYKKYGISLDIKPIVKPNGFIQAMLKTEVSEIDRANAVVAAGISIPAFATRSAETELYLRDNQTVFLAGLIKNKDETNYSKVAGLGELPILGALFRSRDFAHGDTELVVSLTPRIISQPVASRLDKDKVSLLNQSSPKTLLNYIRSVQEKIGAAVVYPEIARRNNAQGEVLLSMHILSDGRLINVLVGKTSGSELLDEASVNIVKSLAPFPPLPAASGLSDIWIDVPIEFKNN